MSTFLQFHLLTTYGPSNPNRDDQGRPKQAMLGGSPRLRMSSQSVKRALRESAFFELDLKGNIGTRSRRFGLELQERVSKKHPDLGGELVESVCSTVQRAFANLETSKPKKGEPDDPESGLKGTTLAFVSPEEWWAAEELAEKLLAGEKPPKPKDLANLLLRRADGAVDIAMFGRMLTDETKDGKVIVPRSLYSRDAAVQVAHAITTHTAQAEEDWYSAVDDLNKDEDTGAGHLGETAFGSGVYYQYVCVNADLLVKNLNGDRALATKGAEALARALAQTSPRGKQNSFAHHPRAHFVLAERGSQAPRDLSGAFFTPVKAQPFLETSVAALVKTRSDIDAAYGQAWDADCIMQVGVGGTLDDVVQFAGEAVRGA